MDSDNSFPTTIQLSAAPTGRKRKYNAGDYPEQSAFSRSVKARLSTPTTLELTASERIRSRSFLNRSCKRTPSTFKKRATPASLQILKDSETRASRRTVLSRLSEKEMMRIHHQGKLSSDQIGKGLNGKVIKASVSSLAGAPPTTYAFKKNLKDNLYQDLLQEIKTALKFDHPNLLKYVGAVTEEQSTLYSTSHSIFTYMELMTGSLMDKLEDIITEKEKDLSLEQKLSCLRDISEGLVELHKNGFIHNDLKLDNILLRENGEAAIGDFGRTRKYIPHLDNICTVFPPEMYVFHPIRIASVTSSEASSPLSSVSSLSPPRSPESEPESGYGSETDSPTFMKQTKHQFEKTDVYGLGYIGLQLITGELYPPVWRENDGKQELEPEIFEHYRQRFANNPAELRLLHEMIIPCLNLEMDERPSAQEAMTKLEEMIAALSSMEIDQA